ncbi:MAG: DNA-binding response regulator [Gammaproteobacteria bacterium]|nr:MAG: DNA-binding response regulator [Gammaproteobacteria bacterium]
MNDATPGRLLLVDDDETFCAVLGRALERRGFEVHCAHDTGQALERLALMEEPPGHAVVDLQMPDGSGLELVPRLVEANPRMRIVVLTGYASIATAVEAIKLGATHYLAKPADADEVMAAFGRDSGSPEVPVAGRPMSVQRLAWEHIQKVLNECDGNISEAARRLKMHRRTLQRKLKKRPVRE